MIAAHGGWYPPNGLVRVPAGDQITTYVPISTAMGNDLGQDIDSDNIHDDDLKYVHVYTAGQLIPNFTLAHLEEQTGKHVVNPKSPTTLNALLQPNEGAVWIAACETLFLPQGETLGQALAKLPIHSPGAGQTDGTTPATITAQGQLDT